MIMSIFHMEVGRVGFREGKQLAQVAKLRFKTRSVLTLKPESIQLLPVLLSQREHYRTRQERTGGERLRRRSIEPLNKGLES